MKIMVISDLHLDTNSGFGTCGWQESQFMDALKTFKHNHHIEQIILNGDIYEMYKHSFSDIENNNKTLVNYLRSEDFIYVKGNHDLINDFGTETHVITNSKGEKILIEHGHNADFLNGTRIGRFISKRLNKFVNVLVNRSKMLYNVYMKVIEFEDEANRIPKKYNSYKYLGYALKLLKQYDVVILGHTHKMELHKTYYLNKKKLYINTGSCSLGRFQAVILDTETLRYETVKVKNYDELVNTPITISLVG